MSAVDDIARAAEHVRIAWDDDRQARLRRGIERRRRRRQVSRSAGLVLAAVAGCVTLYAWVHGRAPEEARSFAVLAPEYRPPAALEDATEAEPSPEHVVVSSDTGLVPTVPTTPDSGSPRQPVTDEVRGVDPELSVTDWRVLVAAGRHHEAYALLVSSGGRVTKRDPAALMEAADAARLSGHREAATGYLKTVLQHHSDSPLAPLAAFTLGRLLLEHLGQPREAADAFARARELSPRGSLAEDALAREVEAWSKAGEALVARQRAKSYRRSYPQGRRLRAVKLFGGLE